MLKEHISKKRRTAGITSRLLLSGSICALAMSATANGAFAQDQDEDDAALEQIVVTGSRLMRRDLEAPSPVAVISERSIRSAGNVTLEETLNELPQLASDNTSSVNSGGGSGVLTLDLRGLGPERTLVLVNGRRWIPADQRGLVDVSSIPDALIDRVEIITGGASAVYGSDAISGAVNFILKDDFEGMEATYDFQQSTRGDATTHKVDLTVGGNFADGRGNAVVNLSYTDRGGVFFQNREFSETSFFNTANGLVPGGSSNVPGTRINFSSSQFAALSGLPFDVDGACPSGDNLGGIRFGEGAVIQPFCSPGGNFNFAEGNYLLRPLDRWQATGIAHYDITDNITAYTEMAYTLNRNEWQQAPNAGGLETNGLDGQLLLPDFANNPLFPQVFRDFLSANADFFNCGGDAVCIAAGGDDPANAVISNTGRRSVETGFRNNAWERNAISFTNGLKGDFEIAGRPWAYDAFYTFQRSRSDRETNGVLNNLRVTLALDVVVDPETGEARCRNEFLGCVPINPFGLNSISPEGATFISSTNKQSVILQRQTVGGAVTGELFELPAGPVLAAFGVEHRRESYKFRPDSDLAAGAYGDPQPPIDGAFNLTEFFSEVSIPIFQGESFADYLGIEAAVRFSDYSNFGSVTTWKLGGEWAPVNWVRVRGSYNVAIRAPNLDELFDTTGEGFSAGVDPCSSELNPSAADKALCVAQGVPAADIDTFFFSGVGFGIVSGGNPDLQEEESDTWTIGAVISPEGIPGLNITVDYWDIKIDGAIDNLGVQQVVDACFASGDINNPLCQSIERFPGNGEINRVSAQTQNLASLTARGVDAQVDYLVNLPDSLGLGGNAASLTLQAIASWQLENQNTPPEGAGTPFDCRGKFGGLCSGFNRFIFPKWKGNFAATYDSGPLSVRGQLRRLAAIDQAESSSFNVDSPPAKYYTDLNASFQATEFLEVFAGIDNIFDTQPPVLGFQAAGDANVDISLYDTVGRRFRLGATARF